MLVLSGIFGKVILGEVAKWAKIVKEAGAHPECACGTALLRRANPPRNALLERLLEQCALPRCVQARLVAQISIDLATGQVARGLYHHRIGFTCSHAHCGLVALMRQSQIVLFVSRLLRSRCSGSRQIDVYGLRLAWCAGRALRVLALYGFGIFHHRLFMSSSGVAMRGRNTGGPNTGGRNP